MNPEKDIFFTIPPEDDRVLDEREMTLGLCRLTYMLLNEFVNNEERKEEWLDFVDRLVERMQIDYQKS